MCWYIRIDRKQHFNQLIQQTIGVICQLTVLREVSVFFDLILHYAV